MSDIRPRSMGANDKYGFSAPVSRAVSSWADENGDWLRNILYRHVVQITIPCGACPRFHQPSFEPPSPRFQRIHPGLL